MVPVEIIALFPFGIVNVHPSRLPKHRGSIPIESVILYDEKETAVSLMSLAKAMDAGPVYAQSEAIRIEHDVTKQVLADHLAEVGANMLGVVLPKILSGDCTAQEQDHRLASYDERITKEDGFLNFSKSAVQLEREIRAYAEWPKSRTVIASKDVVITKAHVANGDELPGEKHANGDVFVSHKQLCIQTAEGVLVVDELKPAGKQAMSGQAFLAGYGQSLR